MPVRREFRAFEDVMHVSDRTFLQMLFSGYDERILKVVIRRDNLGAIYVSSHQSSNVKWNAAVVTSAFSSPPPRELVRR